MDNDIIRHVWVAFKNLATPHTLSAFNREIAWRERGPLGVWKNNNKLQDSLSKHTHHPANTANVTDGNISTLFASSYTITFSILALYSIRSYWKNITSTQNDSWVFEDKNWAMLLDWWNHLQQVLVSSCHGLIWLLFSSNEINLKCIRKPYTLAELAQKHCW